MKSMVTGRLAFPWCKSRANLYLLLGMCLLCSSASRSQTSSTGSWRGPWLGTNSYVVNDLVSYNGSVYINTVATSPGTTTSAAATNLFDLSAVAPNTVIDDMDGSTTWIGGPESTGYVDLGGASTFITNIRIGLLPPFGIAFYDSNKGYVSGFDGSNIAYPYQTADNALSPNQPINVPSGARYVRFWYAPNYNEGTTDAAAIIDAGSTLQTTYTPYGGGSPVTTTSPSAAPTDPTHWSGLSGTTGPVGPAGATGPAGPQGPAGPAGPQGTPGATAGSFLAGRKFGVLGDSISSYLFSNAWQNVVIARTGASLVVQDARPGRALATAFECWGNPPIGGTPGAFQSSYAFGTVGGMCGDTILGITNGETFSNSLANVDLQIIELGTNEEPSLGALGDPNQCRNLLW